MSGFAGVQWTARSTERLATDLGRGAGVSPLVEAGLSWGEIAIEAAAIGDELRRLLDRMRLSWDAPVAAAVLSDGDALVSWLHRLAESAGLMARRLQGQSAATTVALLAMPNPAEIAATAALRQSMTAAGGALGGALLGAGAALDRTVGDQHQRAVRAMQAYETASSELAHPTAVAMPPHRPPARPPVNSPVGAGGRSGSAGAVWAVNPHVSVSTPGPRAAYAATTPASSVVPAAPATTQISAAPAPADPALPIVPMAAGSAIPVERPSTPPRVGAVVTDSLAGPDADLAVWADSVAAPTSWDEVDRTDQGSGALLRLPDPVERAIT
ncbi:PPE domain-containing protein [Jongsikchunia kroppenstedtii]|uniref:PPE domain-containing protein n=1 Tax=Jongsikchunia kroppenstedtii TaxID=1121721 RepID=UPI00036CED4D|nr:PPE domain-containing protein [Jongsikchunia kroppenstedtii]